MAIQAMGFFCQDIRPERENMLSIIGIMPENANLPDFVAGRSVLPRFALYARVQFQPQDNVKSIRFKLLPPTGNIIDLGPVGDEVITQAYEGAKKNGSPAVSLFLRVDMSPFPLQSLGWMKAIAEIEGQEFLIAYVNFTVGLATNEMKETTSYFSQRV